MIYITRKKEKVYLTDKNKELFVAEQLKTKPKYKTSETKFVIKTKKTEYVSKQEKLLQLVEKLETNSKVPENDNSVWDWITSNSSITDKEFKRLENYLLHQVGNANSRETIPPYYRLSEANLCAQLFFQLSRKERRYLENSSKWPEVLKTLWREVPERKDYVLAEVIKQKLIQNNKICKVV